LTLAINEKRFGTDLEMPTKAGAALPKTATGDLRLISGYANLRQAVIRRAMAVPGSMIHRPDYGGGMPLYIEQAGTPGGRSRMSNALKQNAQEDERIARARVVVQAGVVGGAGEVLSKRGATARIEIQVRDDDETLSVTAAMGEGS
jgi:phage baseplate assembly protein W